MMSFRYPWRKSEPQKNRRRSFKHKDTKPDLDNLEKQILDVMERMGFFTNDSQIAKKMTNKSWCDVPGVTVFLDELDKSDDSTSTTD